MCERVLRQHGRYADTELLGCMSRGVVLSRRQHMAGVVSIGVVLECREQCVYTVCIGEVLTVRWCDIVDGVCVVSIGQLLCVWQSNVGVV